MADADGDGALDLQEHRRFFMRMRGSSHQMSPLQITSMFFAADLTPSDGLITLSGQCDAQVQTETQVSPAQSLRLFSVELM